MSNKLICIPEELYNSLLANDVIIENEDNEPILSHQFGGSKVDLAAQSVSASLNVQSEVKTKYNKDAFDELEGKWINFSDKFKLNTSK